jgi:hypothetical protein
MTGYSTQRVAEEKERKVGNSQSEISNLKSALSILLFLFDPLR